MPKYLVNVVYTAEGAKGLRTDGGTKREHIVRMALESVGGKLEAFYFTLGETDAIVIADVPDALAVTAVSLTVSASGAARCSTVPLLSPAEMDHVSDRKTAYKGPGLA
jgi:uncharacterized protein with GYD domain